MFNGQVKLLVSSNLRGVSEKDLIFFGVLYYLDVYISFLS